MTLKKAAFIAALTGAAIISSGYCSIEQEMVRETYTVQPNDCLWSIGEGYVQKNTASRRYILEVVEDIKKENPWVAESGYTLKAGDKLEVVYWVRKENVK